MAVPKQKPAAKPPVVVDLIVIGSCQVKTRNPNLRIIKKG